MIDLSATPDQAQHLRLQRRLIQQHDAMAVQQRLYTLVDFRLRRLAELDLDAVFLEITFEGLARIGVGGRRQQPVGLDDWRELLDGSTRIDFVNGRPDSIDVLLKGRKLPAE